MDSADEIDTVGRGFLTPLFYEDSSMLLTPTFSNFVHSLERFS